MMAKNLSAQTEQVIFKMVVNQRKYRKVRVTSKISNSINKNSFVQKGSF